jgi:arabinogalactan endo-1,4-beta-galactosidase
MDQRIEKAAGVSGRGTVLTRVFRMAVVGALVGIFPLCTASHPNFSRAEGMLSMLGADVSSLQRAEDLGATYYYPNGTQGEPLQILKENGVNYLRLRVWNNPPDGYNSEANVLAFAKLIKARGFKLMIDFHYSDTWADLEHQNKPAAWATHDLGLLEADVYTYTLSVCNALKAQGTTPDSVAIGNEIDRGMLWPDGRVVHNNFTNLARLLKAGYQAAKACNQGTQVMIHAARADSDAQMRWFYDGIKAQGVKWDLTGLSYYCYWQGAVSSLSHVAIDAKSRYGEPVVVAETAYPFTTTNEDYEPNSVNTPAPCPGYPATEAGQYDNFRDVLETARAGGAVGVFYWEPTWVAISGNALDPNNASSESPWDNQALFDRNGVALSAITLFRP